MSEILEQPEEIQSGMSLLDIAASVGSERKAAMGDRTNTELSSDRERNWDYYYGRMDNYIKSQPNRSKAVSTDVFDVIEDLMPYLMEMFAASERAVEFEPTGPEDVEAAQQETDYINFIFYERNNGFLILYGFFKDALLLKNGICKIFWDKSNKIERESFNGLTDDAYMLVQADIADGSARITRHEEITELVIDEMTGQQVETRRHNIEIETTRPYGCARVLNIAAEEFGIDRNARSIDDARYCFHRVKRTVADLIETGYDPEQCRALPSWDPFKNMQSQARNPMVDETTMNSANTEDTTREVEIYEHYIKLDMYSDGQLRLYKVTAGGETDEILMWADGTPDIEQVDFMPFVDITPIKTPNRFWGTAIADPVIEIQNIKTVLLRNALDNLYNLNNQRMAVGETGASDNTMDDLLLNQPGGMVRMRDVSQLREIGNVELWPSIGPMMEYMDSLREQRTGAVRQGIGLDPNALQNTTATGATLLASAAQARVKMIGRLFAETGVRDMFLKLHRVILSNSREKATVRLRGKWVEIDPRQWKIRSDMTVNVGLGYGDKREQLAAAMQIFGIQTQIVQAQGGVKGPFVVPDNVFNVLRQIVNAAGLKDVNTYFTQPDPAQMAAEAQQPPQPDPKLVEAQLKAQLEQQKAMAQQQLDEAKLAGQLQIERDRVAAEAQIKRESMLIDKDLRIKQAEFEARLEELKLKMEYALKKEALDMKEDMAEGEIEAPETDGTEVETEGTDPNFGGDVG